MKNLEKISRELGTFYGREGLELNTCTVENDGVRLEYLQGETLEGRLDELLEAGKTEELEKLFFSYIKKIRRIHEGEMFFKHRNSCRSLVMQKSVKAVVAAACPILILCQLIFCFRIPKCP